MYNTENKIFSDTLMITNKCSAGCSHCPFGSPALTQKHMPQQELLQSLEKSSFDLVVITGGEPMEHPNFKSILFDLRASPKKVRLATGGHIDMAPFLPTLKTVRPLVGISLGTDVLTSRSDKNKLQEVWSKNCRTLNGSGLSYSLTFTLGSDLTEFKELFELTNDLGALPEFIYLRTLVHEEYSSANLENAKIVINKVFGSIPISVGN